MNAAPIGRFRPESKADFAGRAKHVAWLLDTPLQRAQQELARCYGYSGVHELQHDLLRAAQQPEANPPGPIDRFDDSTPFQLGRDNALLELARRSLKLQENDPLPERAWEIREIALFGPSAEHQRAFAAMRDKLNAVDPRAPAPALAAVGYIDLHEPGRAKFTLVGRSVAEALKEAGHALESTGDRQRFDRTIATLRAKFPNNIWIDAVELIEKAYGSPIAYWSNTAAPTARNAPHQEPAAPAYFRHMGSQVEPLLALAERAVTGFEALLREVHPTWRPSHGQAAIDGELFLDYAGLLHWAGQVALAAGELANASKWLSRYLTLDPDDHCGARFSLSALNLVRGAKRTTSLFPKGHGGTWAALVACAQAFADADNASALKQLKKAMRRCPHLVRAVHKRYRKLDDVSAHNNRDSLLEVEEFFFRTEAFWARHRPARALLELLLNDAQLCDAYEAMHRAKARLFGAARLEHTERLRRESTSERAKQLFDLQFDQAADRLYASVN